MNLYRFKGNFKSFLFVLAVVMALGFLYYTQTLVNELQRQSEEFLKFRIKIFEQNINNETLQDLSFFFQEVIQQADYPIIYTDADNNPIYWRNVDVPQYINRPIPEDTLRYLKSLIAKFDSENQPVPISFQDQVLGYYHYGESPIIYKLRWLPYVEIVVVALFILIGYAGFSSIKKSEERYIWVGMAKETAHQLGTPLSSLIGWVEYLKASPDRVEQILPELEKDVQRLKVITNRFSQIGSLPDLQPENLHRIVEETIQYFQKRLPRQNGRIVLNTHLEDGLPFVMVNRDLFSWVLENLIKNALDALGENGGEIAIVAGKINAQKIFLEVRDSGKGIASSDRKNIFKPGFSTKKRGWGLGLSLAKRIIEEYHGGKIFLKESHPGKGSVFRIELKVRKNTA
ncbi:MAG: sensor histidine kinase [Calditrichaeota bacterium]|nr:sensor histidine kinase [Calditrichota bacterium]